MFKGGAQTMDASALATPKVGGTPKPKATPYVQPVSNSSHLDAVPQPTPINRNRVIHKKVSALNHVLFICHCKFCVIKVRSFPLCFDDTDPGAVSDWTANGGTNFTVTPVPEPSMFAFTSAFGACFLWAFRNRRKK